jgi:hypothetical protein
MKHLIRWTDYGRLRAVADKFTSSGLDQLRAAAAQHVGDDIRAAAYAALA